MFEVCMTVILLYLKVMKFMFCDVRGSPLALPEGDEVDVCDVYDCPLALPNIDVCDVHDCPLALPEGDEVHVL
jgi:hypothetical protein